MAYVKLDKDLADDGRVLLLADALVNEWVMAGLPAELKDQFLGAANNVILGGLYRLWCNADTHIRNADRLNLSIRLLSNVTRLPVTVLEKFPPTWLRQNDDGTVTLPGYIEKNALQDKDQRRVQTRERVRRFRERQRSLQLEREKRKRNACNTTPGPGPGPPRPGPAESRSPETQTPPRDPLASAKGRLAGRGTPKESDPEEVERKRQQAAAICESLAAKGRT